MTRGIALHIVKRQNATKKASAKGHVASWKWTARVEAHVKSTTYDFPLSSISLHTKYKGSQQLPQTAQAPNPVWGSGICSTSVGFALKREQLTQLLDTFLFQLTMHNL